MEKAGSEGNNGPGSRKDLNWTVLFVSDTGKVVRVPAFRRYVITAAVVVAVSMIVALCFCALFITARIDTKKATKELETCRARIKSLVDENDRLLAQLAVLENNDTFGNDTEEQDVDAGASTNGHHRFAGCCHRKFPRNPDLRYRGHQDRVCSKKDGELAWICVGPHFRGA
ncbi:MAG: hypothetical protein B5M56_06140 [Desulfococcus sp. 4484_241]|nr:MAG: hypothetical protein B5M56_06140 [Desulfococcus sp. 4484_241]